MKLNLVGLGWFRLLCLNWVTILVFLGRQTSIQSFASKPSLLNPPIAVVKCCMLVSEKTRFVKRKGQNEKERWTQWTHVAVAAAVRQ